jgi:hypothetical protein
MINVVAITVTLFSQGTTMNPNTSVLPAIVGGLSILFGLAVVVKDDRHIQKIWLLPAALSLLFLLFSIQAIMAEGLFGFWTEHTRNLWGSQIWLDLLLAVSIGWFLVVPPLVCPDCLHWVYWFLGNDGAVAVSPRKCFGFKCGMTQVMLINDHGHNRQYSATCHGTVKRK